MRGKSRGQAELERVWCRCDACYGYALRLNRVCVARHTPRLAGLARLLINPNPIHHRIKV